MNTNYIFKTRLWIQIALMNFCIVALAGFVLRYKICFSLRIVNQKHLLFAHSNFAFVGWVTIALMALMIDYIRQQKINTNYKKYHRLLIAYCTIAYGMFISFIIESYGLCSITFSCLSIFISYFFIYFFWRDLKNVDDKSYGKKWLKAALIIWAFSSLGAFTLAWLMFNRVMIKDYYFEALYFFLHFQYNGWFLFACFGLLFSWLYHQGYLPVVKVSKKLFVLLAITVIPTYLLSVMWLKLPDVFHIIGKVAGVLQVIVLIYFTHLFIIVNKQTALKFSKTTKALWIMASIAFFLKIILQMLSVIPYLSTFAYGYRPIIIGYLHLSFIGIISFFIIGYIHNFLKSRDRHVNGGGVIFFVSGFLIQEIILMCQGLEALEVKPVPRANLILFFSSVLMVIGLVWITIGMSKVRMKTV